MSSRPFQSTQVRPRAPQPQTLMMPSGAGDRAQQGVTGFPGSGLYPNHDIWGSRGPSNRNPPNPIGGLSSAPDSEGSPTSYTNPLNPTTAESDQSWASRPWSSSHSPPAGSVSPNRSRNGLAPGSTLFDSAQPTLNRPNGVFDNNNSGGDTNGYSNAFASRRTDSYIDPLTGRNISRESSLAAPRQTQQGTLPDRYRRGHTPSNSVHSQRGGNPALLGLAAQNGNARSFNMNAQVENELNARFRQTGLDDPTAALTSNIIPAPQAFQLNPGTQPWDAVGDWRYGGSMEAAYQEVNGSYFGALGSLSRHSPASSYRTDNQSQSRGYAPAVDSLGSRRSSRDTRAFGGIDARELIPHHMNGGRPHSIVGAFDYAAYANQFGMPPLALNSPYQQPLMNPYALANGLPPNGLPHSMAGLLPTGPMHAAARRDQDPARGVRSALLEEFRHSNKSSRKHDLKDIYNHVVEFSGDQHGSRFIQTKLETANSDEKDQVFREIEPNAIQLMKDVFGNYVVQKFFEHGNQVQKKVLAEKMRGKVVDLSVQVYACRVVQKALEHVLVEQQAELTKELESDILRVIKDQNGNHVVQKVIELVPRQYLDFIMNHLRGQVQTLATHTYGCRVIQRVLEFGNEQDKDDVMRELHASIQMLITDQFGNYVAQHVIIKGKPEDSQRFIKLVLDNFNAYSKHKFASNVVEKCIECATPEQRTHVREMLKASTPDGSTLLQQMIKDQFGNYVVQKLITGLEGEERASFVEEIRPQFFQLKKNNNNSNSKQMTAMEKLLDVGSGSTTSLAQNERGSTSGEASSTSPTPNLTNNTNSPQSASPPSTHASAVDVPVEGAKKGSRPDPMSGLAPEVQDAEA